MTNGTRQLTGKNGQIRVWQWLANHGIDATYAKYQDSYDLIVGHLHIEVKTAHFSRGLWRFNIHRHGKLKEGEVHWYILRLLGVPGFKSAIHLVIPSPIGTPNVQISIRSLVTRWGRFYNKVDGIKAGLTPQQMGVGDPDPPQI